MSKEARREESTGQPAAGSHQPKLRYLLSSAACKPAAPDQPDQARRPSFAGSQSPAAHTRKISAEPMSSWSEGRSEPRRDAASVSWLGGADQGTGGKRAEHPPSLAFRSFLRQPLHDELADTVTVLLTCLLARDWQGSHRLQAFGKELCSTIFDPPLWHRCLLDLSLYSAWSPNQLDPVKPSTLVPTIPSNPKVQQKTMSPSSKIKFPNHA